MAVKEGDVGLGQVSGGQAEHPGHRVNGEHHLVRGVGAQLIEPGKWTDYGNSVQELRKRLDFCLNPELDKTLMGFKLDFMCNDIQFLLRLNFPGRKH